MGKYFDMKDSRQNLRREVAIFGDDRGEKIVVTVLRVLFVGAVMFGSLKEAKTIWDLGDTGVGMMAWINIIAILLLSPKAFKILKDYERQKKQGRNPKFDPHELGIKNADFWEEEQ